MEESDIEYSFDKCFSNSSDNSDHYDAYKF